MFSLEEDALRVDAMGMPCLLMVNPFVTWRMDSVLTVPLTQWDLSVNNASQVTLVTQQESQNALVSACTICCYGFLPWYLW